MSVGLIKDSATTKGQYLTEVNKGSINMSTLTDKLNARWDDGWCLHSIFEQDGNTLAVFERRG